MSKRTQKLNIIFGAYEAADLNYSFQKAVEAYSCYKSVVYDGNVLLRSGRI
jgi:hypothetical protein